MYLSPGLEAALAVCIGITAAALLFLWWMRSGNSRQDTARSLMKEAEDQVVFIFDDDALLDATPQARDLLNLGTDKGSDWSRLLAVLAPSFPDLRQQLSDLAEVSVKSLISEDGKGTRLDAEHWNGLARLMLSSPEEAEPSEGAFLFDAMEREIRQLRAIGENAPQLIWRRDESGVLTWANGAYLQLVDTIHPSAPDAAPAWPPPEVFDPVTRGQSGGQSVERQWVNSGGRLAPRCYDVTNVWQDGGSMHFAVDVTRVVEAQNAQSKFVQTLTKTFAQLSVGLAVFDRDRRLVLFNPALLDLLGLPAEFLIANPRLGAFLDHLREARMIPEPKDYAGWRDQIETLEARAADGSYEQIWDLPNGLSYRVTGRPHPDGAIAFLFEDISEDLILTRRFRAQIELGQNVLDLMDDAVAVFSSTGVLLLSNSGYRQMWGSSGHLALTEGTLSEECALWEARTARSQIWQRLAGSDHRRSWTDTVMLSDGMPLTCHCQPMPNGNILIRFSRRSLQDTPITGEEMPDFISQRKTG